jgi:DME family drug/metabolite transporter
VLWGTTGTAQGLAPPGATPAALGALRLLIGAAALAALAILHGGLRGGGRLRPYPTLLAAAGVAAYQLCFFGGLARTGVAVGTLVAIGSSPLFAGVLGWLAGGGRPGGRWLLSTALAILGIGLLAVAGGRLEVAPAGVGLALGAGFSYAVYALASKHALPGRQPDRVMAAIFGLGALGLLPLLVGEELDWLTRPAGWAVILHLGIVTVAVAYALFARGLSRIPAASAVTLSLAEPLTAACLGVFLLGERLAPAAWAGMALLLSGLALLALNPRPPLRSNR